VVLAQKLDTSLCAEDAPLVDEHRRARAPEPLGLALAWRAQLWIFLLSIVLVALASLTASGVTHLANSSYHTEFANPILWQAGFLLFVPIYLASRHYPNFAFISVIVALGPQFALPAVVVCRYTNEGWSDGLEYLGYLYPILMAPLFAAAAAVGATAGRHKQRSHEA
jgi:hypothetical protein